MFETEREGDVLTLSRPGTTWLSTGWRGGRRRADAAYSVTVPEGWHPADLEGDIRRRLAEVGADWDGEPVLLTGVEARHARGARLGPVTAVATAGLSNPAALPMEPDGGDLPEGERVPGTVNVVVGTTAALADGALANLVAVAAEAKAATLLETVGVPGTTTDAVVAASDPAGEPREFSGSATRVGAAARASVREATRVALVARYGNDPGSDAVEGAEYGVETEAQATVFDPVG